MFHEFIFQLAGGFTRKYSGGWLEIRALNFGTSFLSLIRLFRYGAMSTIRTAVTLGLHCVGKAILNIKVEMNVACKLNLAFVFQSLNLRTKWLHEYRKR